MEQLSLYVDEPAERRRLRARKGALYLGLAVLLAAATLAAGTAADSPVRSMSARGAGKAGSVVPQSAGCAVTFTNPGPPALTACVSGHGNVNNLIYNPFGAALDNVSQEGYCLRDAGTSTVYYDAGGAEAGWGVATQSSTATTTTVTRTTTDGVYTLTQNIFFKYGSRLVLVGNLVKNNDTVSHSVRFSRYADLDIDQTAGNDLVDVAGVSVVAQETNGVALTSLGNPALLSRAGADTFSGWNGGGKSACNFPGFPPSGPGDYVVIMQHETTIAPGATVNFRVGYRLL